MSLSPIALGAEFYLGFSEKGFNGSELLTFSNAIAMFVQDIIGTSFQTADIGLTPNAGVGTGVGLIGLNQSTIQTNIFNNVASLVGSTGPSMMDIAEVIATKTVSYLAANTTLNSTHTPVFSGTGTIIPGSILTLSPLMVLYMNTFAPDKLAGISTLKIFQAIADAISQEINTNATGTVIITGTPPPVPVPGTGSGTGTLS